MGPVGWQEMVVIFIVALVLFGPKKLPELGRTLGKAITEFRRASSELKATFEREMQTLEREHESLKEVTRSYTSDIYNHYDSYDYDSGTGIESHTPSEHTALNPATVSASAPQDAEPNKIEPPAAHSVPGAVPRTPGTELASVATHVAEHPVTAEHNGTTGSNPDGQNS
jgi:TatA/E family protein of Tat protein translocase